MILFVSVAVLAETGKFLLSAKRNRRTTCTEYIISMDVDNISRSSNTYIGKLRYWIWKAVILFLLIPSYVRPES